MSTVNEKTIRRRDFLKITTGATAGAVLGNKVFDRLSSSFLKVPSTNQPAEKIIKHGWCRACHNCYCSILYTVRDGVITELAGNPANPWNTGKVCVRGNSTVMHVYNPYRIKTPLKRTNPQKGLDVDPGWVEISWEEALSTVSEKLSAIQKDDPRKFVFLNGFGADYTLLYRYFPSAFKTPNSLSATGSMCSVHWASGKTHGWFLEQADLGYSKYCISIGNTLGLNFAPAEIATIDTADALERGLKLVVIDPHCSVEASKAEWVPIRPGTDLAFLLAMANVILNELDIYDPWFVKNRSDGPYLVGPDGKYLRDLDTDKPLIWDPVDNKAKAIDDTSIKDYALEGTYTVNSVQARTVLSLIKDHVIKYTPEWAQEITTITAETIRRISSEFVAFAQIGSTIDIDGFTFPYRPAAITIGRGLSGHRDGHLAFWMTQVINILVGAMDVPGGDNGGIAGPFLKPNSDGLVTSESRHTGLIPFKFPPERLDGAEFTPYGFSTGYRLVDVILEPEKYYTQYQPEAMLTFGVNLFTKGGSNPDRISEAFRRIPFIVSISYHFDEHTAFADIVLPECSMPERTFTATLTERKACSLANPKYTGSLVQTPVITPLYQSRQADDIFLDLAERIGILFGKGGLNDIVNHSLGDDYKLDISKKYTVKEIIDHLLKTLYGPDKGVDSFQDTSFIAKQIEPAKVFNYFYFPGNQTRHPMYCTYLTDAREQLLEGLHQAGIQHPGWSEEDIQFYYQPLPSWKPGPTYSAPQDFDLYSMVWKTAPFLFDINNTNSNPYLQEVSAYDPYFGKLLMNPATAKRKGFQDGDQVWVEGQFGGKIGPVPIKVSGLVHPEVVGVASGLSRQAIGMNPITANGIPYNRLISTSWDAVDIVTAGMENSPRVKVYKA